MYLRDCHSLPNPRERLAVGGPTILSEAELLAKAQANPASLTAAACAIVGTFLVLRKMALIGDAISHAVLPGIALAFFLTQSLNSLPMLIGASALGLVTVVTVAAVDNLVKGAAGQAIQAMNLMLGIPEETGLTAPGIYP